MIKKYVINVNSNVKLNYNNNYTIINANNLIDGNKIIWNDIVKNKYNRALIINDNCLFNNNTIDNIINNNNNISINYYSIYLIDLTIANILLYSFEILYKHDSILDYIHYCIKHYNLPLKIFYLNINKIFNVDDIYKQNNNYQFKTSNNIKIINLERRPDRKTNIKNMLNKINVNNYEFFKAIDSKSLNINSFITNKFKYKRKVLIACALSHISIWIQLLNDNLNDYYIIMEDDIILDQDFKNIIIKNENIIKQKEFIYFGYSVFSKNKHSINSRQLDNNNKFIKFEKQLYVGGYFTYSINKIGAYKLLNYIQKHNLTRAIDFINIQAKLECYEYYKHISHTNWDEFYNIKIDSDIQYNYDNY